MPSPVSSSSARAPVSDDAFTPARPPPPAPPPCPSFDGHRDEALAEACRNATPRPNDRILYVGLNEDSAAIERGALTARGIGVAHVESSDAGSVTFRGVSYDVSEAAGIARFAAAVGTAHGLPPEQAQRLAAAIANAPAAGRDELARIALVWAPAESGAVIPSRLVLSGHSSGGYVWGRTAVLDYASVRALAKALPSAARQIEDVHISGCYSEREVQGAARWVETFPNLRTLWAYRGYTPSAPTAHLLDWETVTRGRTSRISERVTSTHPPATAWSTVGGVVSSGLSLDDRRALASEADRRFASYLSGETRIRSAHQPDAERDYGAYQLVAAHADATPAERSDASARAGQLLRLRFWEQSLRGEFAAAHGRTINAALERAGLPPVDFATLSRKEAVAVADAYRARVTNRVDRVATLLIGVADLRPDVLPERWCH